MNLNLILSIIAIASSVVLTGVIIWILIVFKDLIRISKDKEFTNNTKEINNLKSEILKIQDASKHNIQKVGLIKFNPFKETGGNNSFSLALLDGKKNGIIITSLHTRERTRVYLKDIIDAKSKIELSKEEEKALQLSLK